MRKLLKKLKEFLGLTYYTSQLDEFLENYDKEHPKLSVSQRKEIDKYKRVYALRDNPHQHSPNEQLWDKF